jgi:hypothetical protein
MEEGFEPHKKLLDKVRHGKLTPAKVEAEAVRLGLSPLATCPDANQFDPMGEFQWSLPMTVAWIVRRSPDGVREYWDAYRQECLDWKGGEWREGLDGPVSEGCFLEQRGPATLFQLYLSESYRMEDKSALKPLMSVDDAQHALCQALEEGHLQATGISARTGGRTPIPAHEWRDLENIEERGKDVVRVRKRGSLPSGGYEDVALPRKAVMALWGEKLGQPEIRLPETERPSGPGYMPLSSAAQWIATAGGAASFDPLDVSVWQSAYSDLLARLASEEIKVIGIRDGTTEPIAGHHFAFCAVDYPFQNADIDFPLTEELRLRSCPYHEQHWWRGSDDRLVDRRGIRWRRLSVLKSDVVRCWPFGLAEPLRSGSPGRPTSKQLVLAELDRRAAQGLLEKRLAEQARVLTRWLRDTHPLHPGATRPTIENNIRSAFWRYKDLEKKISR